MECPVYFVSKQMHKARVKAIVVGAPEEFQLKVVGPKNIHTVLCILAEVTSELLCEERCLEIFVEFDTVYNEDFKKELSGLVFIVKRLGKTFDTKGLKEYRVGRTSSVDIVAGFLVSKSKKGAGQGIAILKCFGESASNQAIKSVAKYFQAVGRSKARLYLDFDLVCVDREKKEYRTGLCMAVYKGGDGEQ